ncbi:hypothetical protein LT679_05570 [Mucilaginibacter roseus]|uniref:Lipoprotein n=1 Tax=Mucilaginibacter roseus TaxID=1528868 RepID=A0ABS8U3H0_9SPHI|nr:hypothetical protein [Mucilaginibacter roseus]MCD8740063.1 hypothetical protein [Mucilaginibacter roseus]
MRIGIQPGIILIALFVTLTSAFMACKKDKNEKLAEGIVLNTGSPAADGCGWLILMNNTMYSPDNLPASFMQDSLRVKVNYNNLSTRFSCGMVATNGFPQIHITNISKK